MSKFRMKHKPTEPNRSDQKVYVATIEDFDSITSVADIIEIYAKVNITDPEIMIIEVDKYGYEGGMDVEFYYISEELYEAEMLSYNKRTKEYKQWRKDNKEELETREAKMKQAKEKRLALKIEGAEKTMKKLAATLEKDKQALKDVT